MAESGRYWEKRFEQLEDALHDTSVQKQREIEEQFRRSQRVLEGKINVWYQRFAKNNGVSMTEARRLLNSDELEEFRWDVQEYIEKGKTLKYTDEWVKALENASARVHISRLESLKFQTQMEMERLFGNCTDAVDKHIAEIYQSSYYHTAFEIQRGTGIGCTMQRLNTEKLNDIIHKPWAVDGRNFSERVWTSKTKLINNLHNSLTRMCITGEAPDRAIAELAKNMKVSRNQAGNIIMTESAAFSAKAQENCFKDLDIEEFEVVETLDSITCSTCAEMDGKHFPMSEYKIGVTVPPFHPRCRGCTCPYFDDEFANGKRIARDEEGKNYFVPEKMTYREWEETFVHDIDGILEKETIEKSSEKGIMNTPSTNEGIKVHSVGKINKDVYKCITEDIVTDEVIITDERIQHIRDRHPSDYERFFAYIPEIIGEPDYIIKANKPHTATILKEITDNGEKFQLVLRIITSTDNPNFKNSVITFLKINDRTWNKYLRNKEILYKKE